MPERSLLGLALVALAPARLQEVPAPVQPCNTYRILLMVRKTPLLTQDEIAFIAYPKHLRRLIAP